MLVTVMAPLDLPTTPLDDEEGLLFDTVAGERRVSYS